MFPVLLLTARSELDERLEELNLGADDYMTKPFYIEELVARLHTIVRRSSREATHHLRLEDLLMGLVNRVVKRGEEEIYLSMLVWSGLKLRKQARKR